MLRIALTIAIGGFFTLVFWINGLYDMRTSVLSGHESRYLLRALLSGTLILFSVSFFFRRIEVSRLIPRYPLISPARLLPMRRFFSRQVIARLALRAQAPRNVLIYGADQTGVRLMRRISQTPGLGYRLVGFLDDRSAMQGRAIRVIPGMERSFPVVGTGEILRKAVVENDVTGVFLAATATPPARAREIIRQCVELGLECAVIPSMHQYTTHNLVLDEVGGLPLIRLDRPGILYPAVKRAFDILFSMLAIALTGPAWLVISWLIRRDSPGPALFTHERVGRGGRSFMMYKFRTMYIDSPKAALTPKHREDPRITPIGRWLRRTSLDEVPQFFNVLRGEMSVVGPRPEMPFIVAEYTDLQRRRLDVKPGITGLWQISSDRTVAIHENIEYDLYYLENRSMRLDVSILMETLYFVVRGVGAS